MSELVLPRRYHFQDKAAAKASSARWFVTLSSPEKRSTLARKAARERWRQVFEAEQRKRKHKPRIPGFVYIIFNPLGFVKVGRSADPQRRVTDLNSPVALTLAFMMEVRDMATSERKAHKVLKAYHARGEWFKIGYADAVRLVKEALKR